MNKPTRKYSGPFLELPDNIRMRHPDIFGWEMLKGTTTDPTRWEQRGWVVITENGIHTYNLDGVMIRDRVIYR